MTNEQIQALKAAAERALGEEWQYMRPSIFSAGYITNDKGETIVNVSNGDVPANRVRFIELANPAAILSMLAAREADKALIAELIGHLRNAHSFIENTEAFGQEAATGIISCGGAKWNIDASKAALVNSPKEACTLTVKLPKVSTERQNWTTWDWIQHLGGRYQNGNPDDYIEFGSVYAVEQMLKQFSRTVYVMCQTEVVAALEQQLSAAGITLVVGE